MNRGQGNDKINDIMKLNEYIEITNEDNMELMARYPDKYFDLCIVDPPYRDSVDNQPTIDMRRNGKIEKFGNKPSSLYFDELFRISKNQIIWGANNFTLPNYKGFIVWKKLTISENFTMSMAEIAYISDGLGTISKIFEYAPQGKKTEPRIHPTQKPVALYAWILKNYAKKGDKIIDTHFGSGSIACAVHEANSIDKMDLSLVACELDKDYFESSIQRVKAALQNQSLF